MVYEFTYLGSTVSDTLLLDTEVHIWSNQPQHIYQADLKSLREQKAHYKHKNSIGHTVSYSTATRLEASTSDRRDALSFSLSEMYSGHQLV